VFEITSEIESLFVQEWKRQRKNIRILRKTGEPKRFIYKVLQYMIRKEK